MSDGQQRGRRPARKWLLVAGVALGLVLLGVGAFLTWGSVAEGRRQARAEQAVRAALDRWCSAESLDGVRDLPSGDVFDEFYSRTPTAPRPTAYQLAGPAWVRGGAYSVYRVPATLTFAGGPETRVYEVEVHRAFGKCLIKTAASDDVSGTESHARTVLRAWLDGWVAGEDMAAFMRKHPEAAGKMTADVAWASLTSAGKKLVRYEIAAASPAGKGFRFTVTATLSDRGSPETKVLSYSVYKDRTLSGGRWTLVGN